jgi:VWFA-related protein
MASRLKLSFLVVLLFAPHVAAQQIDSGAHPGERVYVDAVVSTASGSLVENLRQQDFTIFDNGAPQTITSFEAVDAKHARIAVFIVIDTLNANMRVPGTTLTDLKRFLKADGGELSYPITLNFVTANSLEFRAGPSRDGKALSASLNKPAMTTQETEGDPGTYPPFQALAELVALERDKPGRKIILFVSPGSQPTLRPFNQGSGTDVSKAQPTEIKLQQLRLGMFGNIVQFTRELSEGQITVYSIDPPLASNLSDGFTNAVTHLRPSDSDANVSGIRSPTDVRWGDLAFQAVAVRSGGLALYSGHDLASSLRQCIADAAPFYEIAFDPVLTDEPNLYHQIKIQITKPGLTARSRQGYYSQPWPGARFAAEAKRPDTVTPERSQNPSAVDRDDEQDASAQNSAPPAPTYVDLPLVQLLKQIPDLKGIQPAQDQKQLPEILEKMGQSVDNFVHNVGDLIANEDVTQQRLNRDGKIKAKERVQDDYLILHHGYEWGANAEYRMDKSGKRLGSIGLDKGFLVTSGHALASIGFSTGTQTQSGYRYLGDQKIGARDAFVLAFAQKPGEVTFTTVMRGAGGIEVDMLTQGILWIDKNNFQILRLRSDLLTPNDEIHLSQLTTDVTFAEVHLQNNPNPLWLPNDVSVFIEIGGERYRNLHRFSNYRRYQVAVKVGNS